MSKSLFFDVLDFCIDGSAYFTYNDCIYKQRECLAMGLSLAPTLAEYLSNGTLRRLYTEDFLQTTVPQEIC